MRQDESGMAIKFRLAGAAALMMYGMSAWAPLAQATPYSVLDPLSYSMGGTGVASAGRGNAVFYNPALLATLAPEQRPSLHLPVVGARFYDRENGLDDLDNYQFNDLEGDFDAALDAYSSDVGARQSVGNATAALGGRLASMRGKSMQREFLGAVVVGIPHDTLGISLVVNGRMMGGALLDVSQNDLDELLRILAEVEAGTLSTAEPLRADDLESRLRGRGLVITEVGLGLARQVELFGYTMSVGVTPKYRQVTSFDYATRLATADFETSLGQKDHSAVDVDVGMAMHYGNAWSTGVAIKDLVGQEYVTSGGAVIEIKPQLRIGAAHTTRYTRVSVDVDLTESPSLGYDSESRYIAVGAELNVFDMTRVRIGYRHNTADTSTSMPTVGMGFVLYGAQLDLAVAANEDEIGLAAQLGFEF